jgi:hypothetical protein
MDVVSQGLKKLTGYYSHQGLATPKASSEPAAFLIHYKNPSNFLWSFIIIIDDFFKQLRRSSTMWLQLTTKIIQWFIPVITFQ